ncbi:MAG: GldG family protein [Granulosicoccus sp.]|nr:GldG family protein [Granulosicoccus sp.]
MTSAHHSLRQNRWIMLLVISIALALLWLNHRYFLSIDVSANARHTLTPTSIKKISELDGPLTILAIVGPNQQQRKAISTLIDRYRDHKSDVTLEFINPEKSPSRVRELDVAPGGELILQFDNRETRLQELSERSFTESLHKLTRRGERSVVFITGHGERDINQQSNSDYAFIAASLKKAGIDVQPLSLVSVPRIPDNVSTVVIAAPQDKFFPGEVASIIDYVSRGGNLLWLIDNGAFAGLKALALELGIDLAEGIVIDASSEAWGADSPTFAVIDSYPEHPINTGLTSPVLLPEARALLVTPLAGQISLPLLVTGEDSWTETGAIVGAVAYDENSAEQRGPLVLGATIERQRGQKSQRIAVIGDADLFASTWIGNGANRDYGQRLLNWLNTDDVDIGFTTPQPVDTLSSLNRQQTIVIGAGFLLVLPILFLLVGIWLWLQSKRA